VTVSHDDATDDDGLLSRVRLIEDQPLAERAAAFGQVHDELQARLQAADTTHG
jgi:hypothetical protein